MRLLVLLLLMCSAWSQQMAPPENCANMTEDKVYKWNWVTKKLECIAVPSGGPGGSIDWADVTGKPATFASDWATLGNKPASYPASSHGHLKADISDFAVSWAEVGSKPATFAPSSHSHPQSEVTNLVSDLSGKAASSHTHVKANITDFAHTHAIADTANLQTSLDGKAASVHAHNANAACNGNDKVRGFDASGVPICAADQTGAGGLPSGIIVFSLSACPNGFTEVAGLGGKFVLGTVAASGDVGTTGGSDTITEVLNHTHTVAVTDPGHSHLTQRYPTATGGSSGFTIDTSMSGTPADNTLPTKGATTGITASTANPAGGVASIDNRPAYIRLIGCVSN
jgi:hypothetical protein